MVHGLDFPQTFSINIIEGLGQVDKGEEQVAVLLLTFLLQLPCNKDHVNGPFVFPEAALALWQRSLVKMCFEMVQQNPGKYLSCSGEQAYASLVAANLVIPFAFVQMGDGHIFELLGDYLLLSHQKKQLMEFFNQSCATFLVDLNWNGV